MGHSMYRLRRLVLHEKPCQTIPSEKYLFARLPQPLPLPLPVLLLLPPPSPPTPLLLLLRAIRNDHDTSG